MKVEHGDIVIRRGLNRGRILVHADGGDCHGTPLRALDGSYYCPVCGISPDMQSCEYWDPAAVRRP